MSPVQEQYKPVVVGVSTSVTVTTAALAGFLAITAGTLTVVNASGTTVINAFPVTAGVYYPLPFVMNGNGATVTTAGGASGTLGVS